MIVLLDSGVLGMVCHSDSTSQETKECNEWLANLIGAGHTVCIPEVCDYETRRNLILEELHQSISNLNDLQTALEYLPLNTAVLLKAAEFWAEARKPSQSTPTADMKELDVDMILCAHAKVSIQYGTSIIVATTNPGHIGLFATAKNWRDITAT